jgi:hypothetical protein
MLTSFKELVERFVSLTPCLSEDSDKKLDIFLAAQDFGKLVILCAELGTLQPLQVDADSAFERLLERIRVLIEGFEHSHLLSLARRDNLARNLLSDRATSSKFSTFKKEEGTFEAKNIDLLLDVERGFLDSLLDKGRVQLEDDVVLVDALLRLSDAERVSLISNITDGQEVDPVLLGGAALPLGEPFPVDSFGGFDKIRIFMWIKTFFIFAILLLFTGKRGAGLFDMKTILALIAKASDYAKELCETLFPGSGQGFVVSSQGKCRKDVYLESITATEVPDENDWKFRISMVGATNDFTLPTPASDDNVSFVAGATGGAVIPLGGQQKMFSLPDGKCASRSTTAILIKAQEVDSMKDNIASEQLLWINEPPCTKEGVNSTKELILDVHEDGDETQVRIARITFRVTVTRRCVALDKSE